MNLAVYLAKGGPASLKAGKPAIIKFTTPDLA